MKQYLQSSFVKHLLFVAALVAVFIVGRSWLQEHDARLNAEATVRNAQTAIVSLQAQKADVAKTAQAQVVILQREAAAVTTAPQAVAALPTVEAPGVNIHAEALQDAPATATTPAVEGRIAVDAVPLYQELNVCKQDAVKLDACTKELAIGEAIGKQKDIQIVALRAKPSFWHRVETAAKIGGAIAAAGGIGYVAGHR
jgi:hypothetical protein